MSFTKYTTTVDFEGVKVDIPPQYKYISRDKYGMVCAWVGKPAHDGFGAGNGEEYPLRLGHQSGVDLKPILRKYRSKTDGGVIFLTGAITEFKG